MILCINKRDDKRGHMNYKGFKLLKFINKKLSDIINQHLEPYAEEILEEYEY